MDNDNLEEVERKLKRYNQEHLLDYYNNLEDGELKTKFKEQLERIDFELIDSLYKNTTKVKGLAIQSKKNDELKIYIEAPEIAKANVVFETPNSAPLTVSSAVSEGKVLWCIISICLLLMVMRSAKNVKPKTPAKPDINEIIKEREKALYQNFKKEVATMPSMNYRLKGYSKHVLKGETIRSYESRMTTRV